MKTYEKILFRKSLLCLAIALGTLAGVSTAVAQTGDANPLEIHMRQWITASGQWRAPNPNYDENNPDDFEDFGINWKWGPHKKHMIGEITGINADGSTTQFWIMYAFYNPVTEKVINAQIGRNGTYIETKQSVRTEPLPAGEAEINDAIGYTITGDIKISRHHNVFPDDNTQISEVYERGEDGKWAKVNEWVWTQLPN